MKRIYMDRNLPISSNLKLYNILIDENGNKFVNIFRSYEITQSAKTNRFIYEDYQMEDSDWWDNISSSYYDSPYLWWMVASFNDVVNPFEETESGKLVKILKKDLLYVVFDDMAEIERL